jgi:hypothetical protein
MNEAQVSELYEGCGYNTTDFITALDNLGHYGNCSDDRSLAIYTFDNFLVITGSNVGLEFTQTTNVPAV